MNLAFTEEIKNIGGEMEISMYQRFSLNEASLFLHCTNQNVLDLAKQHKINYIQITATQIEFFGYQLLQEITGLSRTTIWRLENKGQFPRKVTLSANSVGWRLSEVREWVKQSS